MSHRPPDEHDVHASHNLIETAAGALPGPSMSADGELSVAPATSWLAVCAAALGEGRYLPLDAPFATTTAGEVAAQRTPTGPRALGYGAPGTWLAASGAASHATPPATRPSISAASLLAWRTIPVPAQSHAVLGELRGTAAASNAIARLRSALPDSLAALVALEWVDPLTAHWAWGVVSSASHVLSARFEGEREAVALGTRAAWQSIELAGGTPRKARSGTSPASWGAVHPDLPPGARIVRTAASPDAVPALVDLVRSLADSVGRVGARAWPTLGLVFAYLPPHPSHDEAYAWLRARAADLGADVHVVAPGLDSPLVPTHPQGAA